MSGKRSVEGEVRVLSDESVALCELKMMGYQGRPQKFIIHRTLRINRGGDHLHIVDSIKGSGRHTIERFFVVGNAQEVTISDQVATCSFSEGSLRLEFYMSDICRIWTEENWISESYGRFVKGYVIRCREEIILPFITETHLWFA